MNAIHTPGTLTAREDNFASNSYALDCDGRWLFAVLHNGEQHVPVQRENIRRLAACWNACQSISTAELEAGKAPAIPELLRDTLEIIAMGNTDPDDMVRIASAALAQEQKNVATTDELGAARAQFGGDDISLDEGAAVSRTDDGVWVAAWVYVSNEAVEAQG